MCINSKRAQKKKHAHLSFKADSDFIQLEDMHINHDETHFT